MCSARSAAEYSSARYTAAGTRCQENTSCLLRWADSWNEPAASAPAVNTAMPARLCVPCRCPPDSRSTSQAKAPVRKPNSREIVLSG